MKHIHNFLFSNHISKFLTIQKEPIRKKLSASQDCWKFLAWFLFGTGIGYFVIDPKTRYQSKATFIIVYIVFIKYHYSIYSVYKVYDG